MKPARALLAAGLLLACVCLSGPAAAAPNGRPHARVDLLCEMQAVAPGTPVWAGVRFQLEDGWHTYWKNPGDSGLAPGVLWRLPAGWTAGPLLWPYPHRLDSGEVVDYGYGGDVLLLAELTPPADLSIRGTVTLRADVDWLECKDVCIPGSASVAIELPVRAEPPAPDPALRTAFAAARRALPVAVDAWTVDAVRAGDAIELRLRAARPDLPAPTDAYFFAGAEGMIDHAAPQPLSRDGDAYVLTLQPSPYATAPVDHLEGVLVREAGWLPGGAVSAIAVDTPVRDGHDRLAHAGR